MEFAPQIVKQLPEVIMSEERQLTKLEVKVLARPKAQIRWLKAQEEIIPSEEFQIENFEDGTSILIINDIYPDDSGTITFEAFNALGVATTTTELVVEGNEATFVDIKSLFLQRNGFERSRIALLILFFSLR